MFSRVKQPPNLHGEEINFKGGTMICPHCTIGFHLEKATEYWLTGDADHEKERNYYIYRTTCPQCGKMILVLSRHHYDITKFGFEEPHQTILYPKNKTNRKPCPAEVRTKSPAIAGDYTEACFTLEVSAKASAALSRRCLQQVLRENETIPKLSKLPDNNLTDEIKYVVGLNKLSSRLAGKLDYVRIIGNFAAHPTKKLSQKGSCPYSR